VVTQKKGQGIAFKIPGQDDEPVPAVEPPPETRPGNPRTGVGMLSRLISGAQADTEAVSKLNAEIDRLKLQVGEQLLDPRHIVLTRWADRHPDSFSSQAFLDLKKEIESAGGNVQAIKVRPLRGSASDDADGPRFELVYGSRRTRACLQLGLKVRAVVDEKVDDDQTLYVHMQRENRGRANLSAWEQGVSYHKALNEGLFPSARRLADQIGLDHSNVAKALRVAQLPQEIVGAFSTPIDIQFRWAVALDKAYQHDAEAVLSAARMLAGRLPRPTAAEVFRALTKTVTVKGKTKTNEVSRTFSLAGGKKGSIRAGRGGAVTVQLPRGVLAPSRWPAFEAALQKLLSELPESF
jgi:ParB family transcriptional regulator, chromosome partitioning protein